ncbi:MAG: hypothetical protein ACTSRI_17110, partial [Promethearchaeota archaeon]
LICDNFNIVLKGSKCLNRYPKSIHIHNSIMSSKQDKFYKKIEWIDGDRFEISPELFNYKIGAYQINVEFYQDETFEKKLVGNSIRRVFRYCPMIIENINKIILPTEEGHTDYPLSIISLNEQHICVESNENKLESKYIEDGISWTEITEIIPKDKTKLNLIIGANNTQNKIITELYLPRLQWRMNNTCRLNKFIGKPIILDFDKDFSLSRNNFLEVRLYTYEIFEDLFLKYGNYQIPLKLTNKNKRRYFVLLNPFYEEFMNYIRKNGSLQLKLLIDDKEILLIQMRGKKRTFIEHSPKPKKRKLIGDHSGQIRNNRNFRNELKIHGYRNIKGNKIISALITILSKEVKYNKIALQKMFFEDQVFNSKINSLLLVNNVIIDAEITYNTFIEHLWDVPLKMLENLIDYLEKR